MSSSNHGQQQRHAWHAVVAGAGAGAIATFVCAPLDVLKIRFQVRLAIRRRFCGMDFERHQSNRVCVYMALLLWHIIA